MAIDTRDKRASCLGVAMPGRVVVPVPDAAAEDQGDRQQMAYTYRGISAAPPGGVVPYVSRLRMTWRGEFAGVWSRMN